MSKSKQKRFLNRTSRLDLPVKIKSKTTSRMNVQIGRSYEYQIKNVLQIERPDWTFLLKSNQKRLLNRTSRLDVPVKIKSKTYLEKNVQIGRSRQNQIKNVSREERSDWTFLRFFIYETHFSTSSLLGIFSSILSFFLIPPKSLNILLALASFSCETITKPIFCKAGTQTAGILIAS